MRFPRSPNHERDAAHTAAALALAIHNPDHQGIYDIYALAYAKAITHGAFLRAAYEKHNRQFRRTNASAIKELRGLAFNTAGRNRRHRIYRMAKALKLADAQHA